MFIRNLTKLCSPALLALILLGLGPLNAYAQALVNVNDKFGTPETIPYGSSPNTGECPEAFANTFFFIAIFTNTSTSDLTNLQLQVSTLTNGNQALIWDPQNGIGVGPVPQGGVLPWPLADYGMRLYEDGILSPGESYEAGIGVCLTNMSRFRLFIDIVGAVVAPSE